MSAPESARNARTRGDLVRAAMAVWADSPTAPLAEVAAAAGAGRATLHRYFASREDLVAAVDEAAWERFNDASQRADVRRGSGREALERLCREVLRLEDVLGLVFIDDAVVDPESWQTPTRPDPFAVVVERGLEDGSLDAAMPAEWLVTHCWAALFGAWLVLRTPDAGHLRHQVPDLMVRTLVGGVSGG